MKEAYALELARAHYAADHNRFRSLLLQVASHVKGEPLRRQLQELANQQMMLLTKEQSGLAVQAPPVERSSLVLSSDVAELFDEIVAEHRNAVKLLARGLQPRRRLLLHGPPGNGKTSVASALANAIGCTSFTVSLATLVTSYMGATAANLAELFPALQSGVCLVLDEIDSIGTSRSHGGDSAGGREWNHTLNVLLSLLDQTHGGLLVATTNRLDMLDPALVRRFDEIVRLESPSESAAHHLRAELCQRYGVAPLDVPIGECVSFDDIAKAVRAHARRVALEDLKSEAAE